MERNNPPFMSGVPELLVLKLLAEDELYGYEIVRKIRLATGDAISLGEGVVYPALHALEAAGALRSRRRMVNGRERVYYTATKQGRTRLARLAEHWTRINDGIRLALTEVSHA
ncbi:MAG TPA: PadR family transcriptional regulator [Gemmatimonadaceae bacterium]